MLVVDVKATAAIILATGFLLTCLLSGLMIDWLLGKQQDYKVENIKLQIELEKVTLEKEKIMAISRVWGTYTPYKQEKMK